MAAKPSKAVVPSTVMTGEIVTLSVRAKGVRIVSEDNRSNENAPTHRVFVGRAEIGAAWSKLRTVGSKL